jgi:hypothetical protein
MIFDTDRYSFCDLAGLSSDPELVQFNNAAVSRHGHALIEAPAVANMRCVIFDPPCLPVIDVQGLPCPTVSEGYALAFAVIQAT